MKIRSALFAFTVATAGFLSAPFAQAQHAGHNMTAMPAGNVSSDLSSGEVRAFDLKTRKITLKHGELKNLGMPPMTMVFVIKDGVALPPNLKPGEQVRFRAEENAGVLSISSIQR
ncbi:copper-binding protein [Uliginosibacterium sp. 31-16]|uniref:copper-binding protein n=1 Tax=Uliginosibacterium sp. 31-16 TaxID=3068315 RepID=UPI00273EBD6A|nr:copper-binding protein [Uliginosibacterium sp. 31-16]MDP5238755.1 copper-binding protein [Uliginosibacterium sp. 31-16]